MPLILSYVHNHTQQPQIKSSPIQMTLLPSNVHNLHSTPFNHSNEVFFNSNNLYYPQRCTNALNQFKSPFKCIKRAFNHYKDSNQHSKPPNVYLNTSKHLPMPLHHEAPPKLLRALKPLKIHFLTN